MKDHSIYVYQDRYITSTVEMFLDTATFKTEFYKTNVPYDMILANADVLTSDEQVDKLSREFNIHYRSCIESLIYLLSTRVDFSFVLHKLEIFHQTLVDKNEIQLKI